jgi:hypothetical protein
VITELEVIFAHILQQILDHFQKTFMSSKGNGLGFAFQLLGLQNLK